MASLRQREPREADPGYLKKIRQLPCCICGRPAEAAHLRMGSLEHGKRQTGKGERPSDRWALPLCPHHHRLGEQSQHHIGEERFWREQRIDPVRLAADLYELRDDLDAMLQRLRG